MLVSLIPIGSDITDDVRIMRLFRSFHSVNRSNYGRLRGKISLCMYLFFFHANGIEFPLCCRIPNCLVMPSDKNQINLKPTF